MSPYARKLSFLTLLLSPWVLFMESTCSWEHGGGVLYWQAYRFVILGTYLLQFLSFRSIPWVYVYVYIVALLLYFEGRNVDFAVLRWAGFGRSSSLSVLECCCVGASDPR